MDPLLKAVEEGQEDEACSLIRTGANQQLVSHLYTEKDNRGNSLVHLAVQKSMVKLVSEILSIVLEAHTIKNKDGYIPLHLAVQKNSRPMVKCILK